MNLRPAFLMDCKLLLGLILLLGSAAVGEAEPREQMPDFAQVKLYVERHFRSQQGYRPGDIISQSDVQLIFKPLESMGWKVSNRKSIVNSTVSDTDFIVQQLHRPQGELFMRKISGFPLAYDRLYRLAALPGGRRLVHDLIYKKGGEEMIQYLTTTTGGKNMGKMIGNSARGVDFNQPIDKIATVQRLLERLQTEYDEDLKKRQAAVVDVE